MIDRILGLLDKKTSFFLPIYYPIILKSNQSWFYSNYLTTPFRKILNKLEKDYEAKKIDEIVLKKALSKLFIFSNLRNLQHEFTQTYQTMAFTLDFVDLSGTPWEAIMEKKITERVTEEVTSKVTEELNRQSVIRTLQSGKFTMIEIATIFEVPLTFVQKIKKEMAEK